MTNPNIQYLTLTDGRHVAASEVLCITPQPVGGFAVTLRDMPPGVAVDLNGLGEVRPARAGAEGIWQGERRGIQAWRYCPITNVASPIWGMRRAPIPPFDLSAALARGATPPDPRSSSFYAIHPKT